MLVFIRSVIFNAAFYLTLLVYLVAALPTFLMPYRAIVEVAKSWGRTNLWLLRVICGLHVEWRGLEKIPHGPLIVAAKHQSTWETFALISLFENPLFIIKRELMWIPVFGWYTWKGRMVPVDRGAGSSAFADMTQRASAELDQGRQLIIFPEGTRRPAGAEPKYKFGVAHLYAGTDVACLPVALNSGLYWPRRKFMRYPGKVVVEILDPIAPGLDRNSFFARVREAIEASTARLTDEGRRELAAHDLP
ncbi:MAG TPA: lysophospholipid acyltransferase family protein [Pseudolabrys sp.]|nr:lysophospholipid acyltransferase family protein [Pseudolabrys sp.]